MRNKLKENNGKIRCALCDILIGEGFMNEKYYSLYVYRGDKKLCKWCYEDLIKMVEPDRSLFFSKKREEDGNGRKN